MVLNRKCDTGGEDVWVWIWVVVVVGLGLNEERVHKINQIARLEIAQSRGWGRVKKGEGLVPEVG